MTKTDYVDGASGAIFNVPGPDRAEVRHFAVHPGDDFAQIIPPSDFSPISSDEAHLANFGLPPKPDDPIAAQAWDDLWAGYVASSPIGFCESTRSTNAAQSPNWAGVVVTGASDYRRVAGSARIPHFTPFANCPANTGGEVRWTGIGGYGVQKLIQNGVANYSDGAHQGMGGWWEMLNSTYDTKEMNLNAPVYAEGDLVRTDTYYDQAANKAIFNWKSTATGINITVTASSAGGHGANEFYDGNTGEWIDERPTDFLGEYFSLQDFGTAGWGSNRVYRAGQPATLLTSHPYSIVNMYGTSGELAGVAGAQVDSQGNFSNKWLACA